MRNSAMKVQTIMSRDIEACTTETNLADAAMITWRNDCGVIPVIEEPAREVSVPITDPDICMAVATKHRIAADIAVGEVMTGKVYACTVAEDVKSALRTMAERKVRR